MKNLGFGRWAAVGIGLLAGWSGHQMAWAQAPLPIELWRARFSDPGGALSQTGAAVKLGGVQLVGNFAFVSGSAEVESGSYRLVASRYPIAGLPPPTNHNPDLVYFWPDSWDPPAPYPAFARGMAVVTDSSEQTFVYVVGEVPGLSGNTDVMTIKYRATDLQPVWTMRFDNGGHGPDNPVAIAANGDCVAVTAFSDGGSDGPGIQTLLYRPADGGFIAAPEATFYAAEGAWPADILIADNLAIVLGTTLDSGTGKYRYLTAAYFTVQNEPQQHFATLHGRAGRDNFATDMTISVFNGLNESLYVTGYSRGSVDVPWNDDYFTLKVNSQNGLPVWTDPSLEDHGLVYNGPDNLNDRAAKIAVLHNSDPPDGYIRFFITGTSTALGSGDDIVTLGYLDNDPPNRLWVARLAALSTGEYFSAADGAVDIAVADRHDIGPPLVKREEIFVTGWRTNNQGPPFAPNRDYVTVKYDDVAVAPPTNKEPRWIVFSNPTNLNDTPAALSIFPQGNLTNLLITGRSNGGVTLDDFLSIRYEDIDTGP